MIVARGNRSEIEHYLADNHEDEDYSDTVLEDPDKIKNFILIVLISIQSFFLLTSLLAVLVLYIYNKAPYDLPQVITKKPPNYLNHLRIILAELLGTSTLVFLSCLGSCVGMQGIGISSMHTSFTAGLAVATVIQTFGHISGAHINPAVSINALIVNQISWSQLPSYLVAEIVGSLAGAGLFTVVTKTEYLAIQSGGNGVCVNSISNDITPLQGLCVEIVLSTIMNLAICASWDVRNSDKLDSVSLRIGLLVVVLNLAAGVYTGASMNPSRSFGPAVISGDYKNHWIYWVGPISGAIMASIIYKICFVQDNKKQ